MGRKKKPENEKSTKPGVALDEESRTILSKMMEYETSLRNDLKQSQIIRKCMRLAWDLHYQALFEKYESDLALNDVALLNERPEGKAVPPEIAGANVLKASESSVSGRSTATKKTFRRAG
jgi:hypothetical protein